MQLLYLFEDYVLDVGRRELRRGTSLVPLEPQVFDLIAYLIQNRERVLSKDDLIASIWGGRIVSESALSTRINAARSAIGDSGGEQRLIKTLPRKGVRFVGTVDERETPQATVMSHPMATSAQPTLDLPDKPSIAVLAFANMSGDRSRNTLPMACQRRSLRPCRAAVGSSSSLGIHRSLTRGAVSISGRSDATLACGTCSRVAFGAAAIG